MKRHHKTPAMYNVANFPCGTTEDGSFGEPTQYRSVVDYRYEMTTSVPVDDASGIVGAIEGVISDSLLPYILGGCGISDPEELMEDMEGGGGRMLGLSEEAVAISPEPLDETVEDNCVRLQNCNVVDGGITLYSNGGPSSMDDEVLAIIDLYMSEGMYNYVDGRIVELALVKISPTRAMDMGVSAETEQEQSISSDRPFPAVIAGAIVASLLGLFLVLYGLRRRRDRHDDDDDKSMQDEGEDSVIRNVNTFESEDGPDKTSAPEGTGDESNDDDFALNTADNLGGNSILEAIGIKPN